MKKFIVLLIVGFIFAGCEKENNTYKAKIRIVTVSGIPIQNANVKLTVPVDDSFEFFQVTDKDGIVEFEVKNKAFFDIKTWKGSWRGCGYVEFMKGETVAKDVYIRTFGDPLNTCWN